MSATAATPRHTAMPAFIVEKEPGFAEHDGLTIPAPLKKLGDEAMRIHGRYGYSQEYPIERLYRDAPVLILGERSNEIQQLLIARPIFERYETRVR